MTTALIWFRRDLRLCDNAALSHAAQTHDKLIPVYIHAPWEEAPWSPGEASHWWLHHSLDALISALSERGSRLILRRGPSLEALRSLIDETGAIAVYWNRLYEPATILRDKAIKQTLRGNGIDARSFNGALLHEPWSIAKGNGQPYKVFTPFWKSYRRLGAPTPPQPVPPLPAPSAWPRALALAELELVPRIRWYDGLADSWQPGESSAHGRLEHFCANLLANYPTTRNLPGVDGVSKLSPHLHFGEISPHQVWHAVSIQIKGQPLEHQACETFLRELGWRDFAHHVLYHWPETPEKPMQPRFDGYPWRVDHARLLQAWQQGRTGYPMVDAGMRQLWHTGWMHNRVRMLVASLLVKNCRIPWQQGERWFWDTLIDADLASNTLGWQWTAGCGTDAAPYFRIFNPVRQGEQLDPQGAYVRRWLPELAKVPERWVHRPWMLPAAEQRSASFIPGLHYPKPVLDFADSRSEALKGFQAIQ